MTDKLDIEGIRERHETMEAFKCNTPSLQTTHTDRGNLLIEVDRLQGELESSELKRSLLYEGHGELLFLCEHLKHEEDLLIKRLQAVKRVADDRTCLNGYEAEYIYSALNKGASDE